MEKPGCSLTLIKVAAEEEAKGDQNEVSEEVLKAKLVGFLTDPSNSGGGVVSGVEGPAVSSIFPPEVI